MKLKITAIGMLVAAVAFVMTACGSSEDGKVTTTTNVSSTSGSTAADTSKETSSGKGMIDDLSEKLSSGASEAGSDARRIF